MVDINARASGQSRHLLHPAIYGRDVPKVFANTISAIGCLNEGGAAGGGRISFSDLGLMVGTSRDVACETVHELMFRGIVYMSMEVADSWELSLSFTPDVWDLGGWPRSQFSSPEPATRKPLKWRDALKIVMMNGERFICAYCDWELDLDSAEVDHIVPVSLGGGNELKNLEIVCRECNRKKGAKTLDYDLLRELRYGSEDSF